MKDDTQEEGSTAQEGSLSTSGSRSHMLIENDDTQREPQRPLIYWVPTVLQDFLNRRIVEKFAL